MKSITINIIIFWADLSSEAYRGKILDIKEHKKWKYTDDICVGCETKSETFEEVIFCTGLMETDEIVDEKLSYNVFLGGSVEDMERIAKI